MRTPLLLLTLLLTSYLHAQTTGKLLILSNMSAQVLVDSVAIGDVEASTPFVHEVSVGEHRVQLVHGSGETSMVQNKTVEVADGQLSAMNFIFERKETIPAAEVPEQPVKVTGKE
ncbi:MAG: hypothetical protein KA408_07450 [Flavobacteriales bacterium]|nr:hypothetical protein [Flavobacteriales bacterium]